MSKGEIEKISPPATWVRDDQCWSAEVMHNGRSWILRTKQSDKTLRDLMYRKTCQQFLEQGKGVELTTVLVLDVKKGFWPFTKSRVEKIKAIEQREVKNPNEVSVSRPSPVWQRDLENSTRWKAIVTLGDRRWEALSTQTDPGLRGKMMEALQNRMGEVDRWERGRHAVSFDVERSWFGRRTVVRYKTHELTREAMPKEDNQLILTEIGGQGGYILQPEQGISERRPLPATEEKKIHVAQQPKTTEKTVFLQGKTMERPPPLVLPGEQKGKLAQPAFEKEPFKQLLPDEWTPVTLAGKTTWKTLIIRKEGLETIYWEVSTPQSDPELRRQMLSDIENYFSGGEKIRTEMGRVFTFTIKPPFLFRRTPKAIRKDLKVRQSLEGLSPTQVGLKKITSEERDRGAFTMGGQ